MHIGLFCTKLPDTGAANGIVTYVRIMRDALTALGHRVTVIAEGRVQRPDGSIVAMPPETGLDAVRTRIAVGITPHCGDGPGVARWIARMVRFAHRLDPLDVVEMEESFGWFAGLSGRGDPPVVVRLHGPHRFGRDMDETGAVAALSQRRIAAEEAGLRRAGWITSPSATLMDALQAAAGFDRARATAIPNPIALEPAEACWSQGEADASEILCVGRFDRRKGADLLLRAFVTVAEKRPELRLTMVGPDGGIPDGGAHRHFADYADAHLPAGVRARVTHLGPRSAGEIGTLRRRAGLSVVASRFENFPYAIAEAMAAGVPLVVSDSYGNAELVQDGKTGRVVPTGDADALARGIEAALAEPDRMADFAAAGRARCAGFLSPEGVAKDTLAIYERAAR